MSDKKLYITGLYGCSCHPFESWKDCEYYHNQKLKTGTPVITRHTEKRGVVARYTGTKGFYLVRFGPENGQVEQYHAANLIRT